MLLREDDQLVELGVVGVVSVREWRERMERGGWVRLERDQVAWVREA